MSVNWIEKERGLAEHLFDSGYSANHIDGVTHITNEQGFSSDTLDTEAQVLINAYNEIVTLKTEKIEALKVEGLTRIQVVFPAITSFDEVKLIRHQFLSIVVAARNPTIEFQKLIDIYGAGSDAVAAIDALSTGASVVAYDVVSNPVWPA